MRRSDVWWRTLGRLDVLVTAAGIVHRDPLEETTESVWRRVVEVVLTGTFLAVQAAVPVMRAQGYGKIVTISSISGIIGGAVSRAADSPDARRGRSGPAYAAAKGGSSRSPGGSRRTSVRTGSTSTASPRAASTRR